MVTASRPVGFDSTIQQAMPVMTMHVTLKHVGYAALHAAFTVHPTVQLLEYPDDGCNFGSSHDVQDYDDLHDLFPPHSAVWCTLFANAIYYLT